MKHNAVSVEYKAGRVGDLAQLFMAGLIFI